MAGEFDWRIVAMATSGLALAAAPLPALARTPSELSYIEGMRAKPGENAMRNEGYSKTNTKSQGGQIWQMWHNDHALNKCVGMLETAGYVEALQGFAENECHKSSAGAAVAGVAIAALLGAALTSHHDKHHDGQQHYSNAAHEAEFERGYNDGLYNHHFVNHDHNQNYSDGFAAGSRERENRAQASRFSYADSRNNDGHDASRARAACAREADRYWGLRHGSTQATHARHTGNGMIDVTVVSGYQSGTCTSTIGGDVKFIQDN